MLSSLTIQDFVIVDRLELHFHEGMSVLSGETGAGKSILIDALSLCLGARADASQVREGCERANITAVFDPNPAAMAILAEQSLDTQDGELHLRRSIDSSGRSKAYVNGTPVPASVLKQLSETLIDIHGQHAFQTLGKASEQLRLLDEFGQLSPLLEPVRSAYKELRHAEQQLEQASMAQAERAARLDNLNWKLELLDKVAPKAGEWEQLTAEHDRLSHGAELMEGSQAALASLSESEQSILDQLNHLMQRLSGLATRDARLESMVKNLTDGEILLREAAYELAHYVKHADLDPDSLAQAEQRLSQWHDTARKLRLAPEMLHEELDKVTAELTALQEGMDLDALKAKHARCLVRYTDAAQELTQARTKAAKALSTKVSNSMQHLNMQGGQLVIDVQASGQASAQGSDSIEFRVAGHPGVTPQPIQKVASGGELARISLAITVNTVTATPVPTLIFDEVDSGIGGAVAETVGRYLRELGAGKQVLCVTHLPQVAAQGNHHFRISKQVSAGATKSTVQPLNGEERISEVARMLGGQTISEATRQAASEMIASASEG